MLGRWVELLTAVPRWAAKLLVIASLSRLVDDLPGLFARPEGAARLTARQPSPDEAPSAEKSLVDETGLRLLRWGVEARRLATNAVSMESLCLRVSPWAVALASNERVSLSWPARRERRAWSGLESLVEAPDGRPVSLAEPSFSAAAEFLSITP